ncbi:MAG: ABC transporter substrate-binding protein [Pseudanabaenaceae cyanobacterium]
MLPSSRWRRAWLFLLLLGITALLLMGCQVLQAERRERWQQQLVASILTDPRTFNPVLVTDATSSTVLGLLFNSLLQQNGRTGELEPDLAEKWEIKKGGLEVIFTLKEGLKWSDGQPLTADDVVFTFQDVIFNPQIPSSSRDVLAIGKDKTFPKIEKLDDRRIKFTLREPFAPFVRFYGGTNILPKHILEKTIQEKDERGAPKFLQTWTINTPVNQIVGSGMYKFLEYVPGQRFIYSKNPFYWEAPKPFINQFVYQIVESIDTALVRFRNRELDIYGLRGEDFQLLKKEEKRGNFTIYNGGPAFGQTFLMFNLNQGRDPKTGKPFVNPIRARWFNNVNFRRAIAYAIDRQAMINTVYRGLGEPQNSPISVQSPYFRKEGLPVYEYNPEKAKQLLLAAGFRYNENDRLIDDQGNLVRFVLQTNASSNPVRGQLGAMIKTDLDKIGITVDVSSIDFNILIERIDRSKDWEAVILGFTGGVEPHGSFNLWSVDGTLHMFNKGAEAGEPPIPGRVVADWEQEISDLMVAGAREVDEQKRKEIYGRMQVKVQEYLPLIHLVTPLAFSAVRNRIQGVEFTVLGGALWNLPELRLTAE